MIPAPQLDDRSFQDLVDDAKRAVQRRCPEWTDHNVSDPGVTLIELFADMTEQLLYRLNRVPDKHHLAFLDLLGLQLFPPTAATVPVTFWLSAPRPQPVVVPVGTEVATSRGAGGEPVGFCTREQLVVVPCSAASVRALRAGATRSTDLTDELRRGGRVPVFSAVPEPGDALLVGLDAAVPGCAVAVRLEASVDGIGVDPDRPPLRWEAFDGAVWVACELDHDDTGGLNRPGDVVLHVPRGHALAVLDDVLGGWLRAVVVSGDGSAPDYSQTPVLRRLEAMTVGGTALAAHADVVLGEVLGEAEGVPGQLLRTRTAPLVAEDEPLVLEVSAGRDGGAGWTRWTEVDDLSGCGPDDPVFTLDRTTGELQLGPLVRLATGGVRQYGSVPPPGSQLRLPAYRTGGGPTGNVAAGAVSVLRSSLPFVARVDNRRPATGGRAGEDLDDARQRGPVLLRTRDRAVTAEDFCVLAREAAPEVGRVHCVPASEADAVVRVLVVPALGRSAPCLPDLVPGEAVLGRIAAALDARRLLGTRVSVEPPRYQGVTVVARLRSRPDAAPDAVRAAAVEAVDALLHPVHGGPDGMGWPFGRPVSVGELYALLQGLPGVDLVEDVRLFRADPTTGEREQVPQRVEVAPHALVHGYRHSVLVERSRFL